VEVVQVTIVKELAEAINKLTALEFAVEPLVVIVTECAKVKTPTIAQEIAVAIKSLTVKALAYLQN